MAQDDFLMKNNFAQWRGKKFKKDSNEEIFSREFDREFIQFQGKNLCLIISDKTYLFEINDDLSINKLKEYPQEDGLLSSRLVGAKVIDNNIFFVNEKSFDNKSPELVYQIIDKDFLITKEKRLMRYDVSSDFNNSTWNAFMQVSESKNYISIVSLYPDVNVNPFSKESPIASLKVLNKNFEIIADETIEIKSLKGHLKVINNLKVNDSGQVSFSINVDGDKNEAGFEYFTKFIVYNTPSKSYFELNIVDSKTAFSYPQIMGLSDNSIVAFSPYTNNFKKGTEGMSVIKFKESGEFVSLKKFPFAESFLKNSMKSSNLEKALKQRDKNKEPLYDNNNFSVKHIHSKSDGSGFLVAQTCNYDTYVDGILYQTNGYYIMTFDKNQEITKMHYVPSANFQPNNPYDYAFNFYLNGNSLYILGLDEIKFINSQNAENINVKSTGDCSTITKLDLETGTFSKKVFINDKVREEVKLNKNPKLSKTNFFGISDYDNVFIGKIEFK